VVAERDRVRAVGEQLLCELGREPDAVGRVLAVDNADVDVVFLAQAGEALLERAPTGNADDIGDEEDDQGRVSAAAGKTWTVTWLPASRVYRARA
jgi:hypothetical protein